MLSIGYKQVSRPAHSEEEEFIQAHELHKGRRQKSLELSLSLTGCVD